MYAGTPIFEKLFLATMQNYTYHPKYIHFVHKDPYFAMNNKLVGVIGNTFCWPIYLCEALHLFDILSKRLKVPRDH